MCELALYICVLYIPKHIICTKPHHHNTIQLMLHHAVHCTMFQISYWHVSAVRQRRLGWSLGCSAARQNKKCFYMYQCIEQKETI